MYKKQPPDVKYTFAEAHGRYTTKSGRVAFVEVKPDGCVSLVGHRGRFEFMNYTDMRRWLERN